MGKGDFIYSKEWFDTQKSGSVSSAQVIVPVIMEFVNPRSVVDVGCGIGTWLSVFLKNGVSDVLGIDGDWVAEKELFIPKGLFRKENVSKEFNIGRKADLTICLEVGEHIPEPNARILVQNLVNISPTILFSAAIPGQPGTNHINCKWPEYWASLFKEEGYLPVDCIRRRVWTNKSVEYWYAQNTILYVKADEVWKYPKLQGEISCGYDKVLPLVHPKRYSYFFKPRPTIFFRLKRKICAMFFK